MGVLRQEIQGVMNCPDKGQYCVKAFPQLVDADCERCRRAAGIARLQFGRISEDISSNT
jgi:hypothetical protein